MSRSWITSAVVLVVAIGALLVASPLHDRIAATWLPACTFAIDVGLITLAGVELCRAAVAWFTRSASLAWIAGGVLVSIGLYVAGSSSITNVRSREFDWLAIVGILTAVGGMQLQYRSRTARAGPA